MFADKARQRPAEQNARQQAGHDRADGGAAFPRRRQMCGEGNDLLCNRRARTERDRSQDEKRRCRRKRHGDGDQRQREKMADDHRASADDIPERQKEEQPQGESELGCGRHVADRHLSRKLGLHQAQNGLAVIDVGHRDPAGSGHRVEAGAAELRRFVKRPCFGRRHALYPLDVRDAWQDPEGLADADPDRAARPSLAV